MSLLELCLNQKNAVMLQKFQHIAKSGGDCKSGGEWTPPSQYQVMPVL